MSLEQRVRSTLKDAGSRIATTGPPVLRKLTAPSRSKRRRLTSILAFVGAFVGVLLVGVVTVLLSGDDAPQVTRSEVLRLDSSEVDAVEWTAVDALPGDYVVNNIAEGASGWMALAGRFINNTGGDYLILRSDDGVEWSRIEGVLFPAAVHLDQIVGGEDGYAVFGLYAGETFTATTVSGPSNFPEPAVWTSADGTDWQLRPLPLPSPEEAISPIVSYRVFHLAMDNGLAIAVGVEFDEDLPDVEGQTIVPTRPIMWESTQRGEWRLVRPDHLEEWGGLASGPVGIVATGGAESSIVIMSWTGEAWEETASVPGNRFQASLTGNEHGYLLGTTGGILFSPDASSWVPVDGPAGGGVVVTSHSGGFMVIDNSEGAATVWWSPDGTRWAVIGSSAEFGDDLGFIGGAVSEHAVAVFGQSQSVDIDDTRGFLLVGTKRP